MSDPTKKPLGIAGRLTQAFIASSLTPLLILAALAAGLVALGALPREEEPQISVPMVDIHVQAQGLKAEDAVKLVTEPLEVIVKGINGVEHVYSNTRDDAAMVMARFEVGTKAEDAILRVHDKVRANLDRIPVGIPEPLIIGRGIDDVAILSVTLSARPGQQVAANDLTRIARALQAEVAKTEVVALILPALGGRVVHAGDLDGVVAVVHAGRAALIRAVHRGRRRAGRRRHGGRAAFVGPVHAGARAVVAAVARGVRRDLRLL